MSADPYNPEDTYPYWAGRLSETLRIELESGALGERAVACLAEFDAWCAERREQVGS